MKKLFKVIGIIILLFVVVAVAAASYVTLALPNVGDAPELTVERTPARVERGKYLANHVTVCMDCHSTRDWNLFAGPITGVDMGSGGEIFDQKLGFPGKFISKNITPYGIGNWTDGELFRAITTGVNKDGKAMFPVMPYHAYGKMDPEDVHSIIAYLRTLSPVKKDIPASEPDFPVSILINTMPAKAAPGKRPSEDNILATGEYLVTSASCVDCHSKREKGNIVPGSEFGGGQEFKLPSGTVTSQNISPDVKTGIGSWSEDAFVKRFKIYKDSNYVTPKVGPKDMNTVMPWAMYSGIEEKDLRAMYAYLRTLEPKNNMVTKFVPN
ncbi:c-type cytochrome [Dyadobacter sp. CY351]|uniref:c-type cytochrome n=1 Tax=Dyadobacter sp. CY351 TaxID=2909337 RepID=UPI001F24F7A4|nr:c-type cytochrome [Dyadobacter sp. CY351]MCF2518609.1 cytochrome c [Dyadobacter sp. CY351]